MSGRAGTNYIAREILQAIEHKEIDLPEDVIKPDGSLDIYEEVQTYLEIQYKRKRRRFVLRNNGWVGHIPLNDRFMLEIETRVPVANLERILERAPIANINLFSAHSHSYTASVDKPKSLFDILTDRFLYSLDEIRGDGLLKQYKRREQISSSPSGRVDPFRTAVRTFAVGAPKAVYSSFVRTTDIAPNRLLRAAIQRLITYYVSLEATQSEARFDRLLSAYEHFGEVGDPAGHEISSEAIGSYARYLPEHRTAYFDAMRFAGYIMADRGMAIRGSGGLVMAPAAVVDFAAVFENYARAVLKVKYTGTGMVVLDGNVGGDAGAKDNLFSELFVDVSNSEMQPDIVLKRGGKVELIIDVKYKQPQSLPDRSDTEQLVCYATRYGCDRAMVLYPAYTANSTALVEPIGKVGHIGVFRGVLDLGSVNLEAAEEVFAKAALSVTAN